ncbi:hypothetical protein ABZV24_38515 [Streptomyces sp. NPDC005251]
MSTPARPQVSTQPSPSPSPSLSAAESLPADRAQPRRKWWVAPLAGVLVA